EWNVNEAYGGMDPAKAYPGDHYVDIVGMDFYFNPQWQNWDSAKAFEHVRDQKYGLQWLEDFAKAHGKPTAYSEWGAQGNNASGFIKAAADWFESHNVVYQSYWDSNAQYPGRLSDGSDWNTGSAYKSEFRNWNSTEPSFGASPPVNSGSGGSAGSAGGTGSDNGGASTGAKASAAWTTQSWGGSNWTGTDGNDWHQSSGRAGETMRGGKGDDTYYVMHPGDKVIETAGGGTDTVVTWLGSYTLPDHVENLTFYGQSWSRGTGNNLDNIIIGNDAPNVLNGKGGNNILTGGGGADTFVIEKGAGHNTITDFRRWEGDKIDFRGFGDGTYLNRSGDEWSLRASDGSVTKLTISGVTWLSSSDYMWS
ncbi:glycosyl hydrolase, partial [Pseudoroseomonas globiformis]